MSESARKDDHLSQQLTRFPDGEPLHKDVPKVLGTAGPLRIDPEIVGWFETVSLLTWFL